MRVWFYALLCFLALQNPAAGKRNGTKRGLPGMFTLNKKQATSFLDRKKRGSCSSEDKEELEELCCTNTCSWEERAEVSCSWASINDALCEFSIRENQKCRCKRSHGAVYECGGDELYRNVQRCICPSGWKVCNVRMSNGWPSRMCFNPKVHGCNGINDCGNWEDEKNCKKLNPEDQDTALITVDGSRDFNHYWYCAANNDGIIGITRKLVDAQKFLSFGTWSQRHSIIPMRGTTPLDPHIILPKWKTGANWWGSSTGIRKFQNHCKKVRFRTSYRCYDEEANVVFAGGDVAARVGISLNQCKQQCGSDSRCVGYSYYGAFTICYLKKSITAKNPFPYTWFSMTSGRCSNQASASNAKCEVTKAKCDGDNGAYCRISKACTVKNKGTKMEGTVIVGGRPICDTRWGETDAYVACRSAGFSDKTKAIPHSGGYYGFVRDDFIMSDVVCDRFDSKLPLCDFKTSNYCGPNGQAGATCIDPKLLVHQSDWIVRVGYYYFCNENWGPKESAVLCNTIKGKEFEKRDGIVPVYKTHTKSHYGKFNIKNTRCYDGREDSIAKCSMSVGPSCSRAVGVECAKCTPPMLMKILKMVRMSPSVDDILASVKEAKASLLKTCYRWDCSKGLPDYKEYCSIKAFFEDAILMLKQPSPRPILSMKINYAERLKHEYMKDNFNQLRLKLGDLKLTIGKFQRELSKYFSKIAEFDTEKLNADYIVLKTNWAFYEKQLDITGTAVSLRVNELFKAATVSVETELADALAMVVLAMLSFKKVEMGPGDYADSAIQLNAELGRATRAAVNIEWLKFLKDELPKIKKLGNNIRENVDKNEALYQSMANIAKAGAGGRINLEDAKRVVTVGNDVTLSFQSADSARMLAKLEFVVDKTCELFSEGGSMLSGMAQSKGVREGVCPKAKEEFAVLTHYYEKLAETEEDYDGVIKAIAAAKLAQDSAKKLGERFKFSLSEEVDLEIAKFNAFALMRNHKLTLIHDACHMQTYMEHGIERPVCKKLKKNPDESMLGLIDYTGFQPGADVACPKSQIIHKTVDIPVGVSKDNKKLPNGTLNLFSVMAVLNKDKKSSLFFQVPNKKWLVDNGWLTQDQINKNWPFFITEMSIYPFPFTIDKRAEISTTMTMLETRLNGIPYTIEEPVNLQTRMTLNDVTCPDLRESPYDLPFCPEKFDKLCVIKPGSFDGPIFPNLMSKWKIEFDFHQIRVIPQMFTETPLYLKAQIKMCQTDRKLLKRSEEPMEKKAAECCVNKKKHYYDRAKELSHLSPCTKCPQGSVPRLHGNYCEKCPAGYKSAPGTFGCVEE